MHVVRPWDTAGSWISRRCPGRESGIGVGEIGGMGQLRKKDLEIGTGAVEGAVKNIIGRRFDHGGMRWIRERAEALLQLRCIEVNGNWEQFLDWVQGRLQEESRAANRNVRLLAQQPGPLPTDGVDDSVDAQSEAA